ncbi:MAG: hypothetical protein M9899_08405 [Bdellovibrionaceae bacterium]|nr:hypothetical protein [Pseudobdellovibrionaceae bacterium]
MRRVFLILFFSLAWGSFPFVQAATTPPTLSHTKEKFDSSLFTLTSESLLAQADTEEDFDLETENFDFQDSNSSDNSESEASDEDIENDPFDESSLFDGGDEETADTGFPEEDLNAESPAFEDDSSFATDSVWEEGEAQQIVEDEIKGLNAPPVERVQPKETNRHYYIKHPNQKKGLYKITSDGKYYYRVKESPKKYGIAVKGGAFLFKDLMNQRTQNKFTDVYGNSAKPSAFVEYLWPFFRNKNVPQILKAARLKLGAGLIFANGNGIFGSGDYSGIPAPEKYTFIGIPIEVGLQYALEFYDEQIFIPYGTAALSYMVATEIQDGSFKNMKYLGQAGAHFSGGVALGLGWLEESAKFDLDAEFGINQAYLTVEFRQNIAIQQEFKFTSASIVGGLWLEF